MVDARVLAGRYRLESLLGRGGMAEVYLGTDEVLGRPVAIKVLAPQFAGDPSFVERFRREAQAAAALNHPNLVGVFDTGSDDGTHFIVMEYVQGRTLAQVIRAGPILPERAVEIAEAVATALAFAHKAGLVHRDIKPANIMLTPSGDVKVMDFGIARATASDAMTQTATVLGTATYFSPEQAQGEPVDARSDIYSLGCVLYEMLTGQPPFDGDSAVAVAYKHVRQTAARPSSINPDVAPQLDAVALKCLEKDPAERYQSADELRADLERMQAGHPIMAAPSPSTSGGAVTEAFAPVGRSTEVLPISAQTKGRRNPWVVAGIVAAVLLVLGGGFFALAKALTPKNTVAVPSVTGIRVQAAKDLLTAHGFVSVVKPQTSDTVAKGFVIDYSPKGNQPAGATITLIVSTGPQEVAVPNVVCETRAQAESDLIAANLVPVRAGTALNATCPTPGLVAKQNPPSPNGTKTAPKGSNVLIWIVPETPPTSPSPTSPPPTSPPPTSPPPTSPPPTTPSPTP